MGSITQFLRQVTDPKIKNIIKSLKNDKLNIQDVPDEFALNPDVIKAERILKIRHTKRRGFDVITQTFFVEEKWFYRNWLGKLDSMSHKMIFSSFKEYYEFLDGDIYENSCYYQYTFEDEFSKTLNLDINKLSKSDHFISDVLENHVRDKTKYKIDKGCDYCYNRYSFYVQLKELSLMFTFEYFFDFIYFLNKDLTDADLILCDGLKYLSDNIDINLTNAKMTSSLCDKFGITYQNTYGNIETNEFAIITQNEENTALILTSPRDIDKNYRLFVDERVGYITDLHLMHRIKNAHCKTEADIDSVLRKIVYKISQFSYNYLLIGGDTSTDYFIFEKFVQYLRKYCYQRVIFVLGNHEFWQFPDLSIDEVVEKYRTLLKENGMTLLHNEILFEYKEFGDHHKLNGKIETLSVNSGQAIISYQTLLRMNETELFEHLKIAKLVILGGVGFAGYNNTFNADNGIYRDAIDRNAEINETHKFENIFNKFHNVLEKKNSIILTHNPKCDWCSDGAYNDNLIYVNGHTHRNYYYDDGLTQVYADNQIGYYTKNIQIKGFIVNGEYNLFDGYEDGMYKITPTEYRNFSQAKAIQMNFNRENGTIHMLKKNSYYCFIYENDKGTLFILNGGKTKKLEYNDINYYYNNMDSVIDYIEKPLKKYQAYLEKIADEIKRIGGCGYIHGCIIDIDIPNPYSYNHIYVNPIDMKITYYCAFDMISKWVYPNIQTLLEKECPQLYENYINLIESNDIDKEVLELYKQSKNEVSFKGPIYYESTDIYKMSRELKKMQKLDKHILTTWYENNNVDHLLLE